MDANQTPSDERLWDALARWEELYQDGRDLSAEGLCRDRPDLIEQVKERIAILKRTAWMIRPAAKETDPQPDDASDLSPRTLGEYTVLERIGGGGMGQVFKALHRRMDRTVVLKLLPRSTSEAAHRFQDEARAAAKLVHPNIVTAYDAGEQDGISFLVMEFTDGTDLHRHVQERGSISVEKAIHFILQAATGLEFAHGQAIVHRDVKPANLLLCGDGTVKILDMGLARVRSSQTQDVGGTPDFLAPELALDPSKVDARTDIYALGCTLWYLLTGKVLYEGGTVIQKIMAHREQPIPFLRALRPDVPHALDALFRRMVAKRPEDRFGSAGDVVNAIQKLKQPASRRYTWLATILVTVVAAFGTWFVFREAKQVEPPSLRAFNLDFTATTDSDLEQFDGMADLGELRLTRTKVTNAGLEHLVGCTRLRFLDLHHTAVGDEGLAKIANLTELRNLGLSGTKPSNDGLRHLEGMKRLRHLNLDFTEIGDAGLAHLAALTALEDLRLTRTKITNDGLAHFKGLTKLKHVDLHHTAVTDEGLKHLAGLPLKSIGASGTKITAAGLKAIGP